MAFQGALSKIGIRSGYSSLRKGNEQGLIRLRQLLGREEVNA